MTIPWYQDLHPALMEMDEMRPADEPCPKCGSEEWYRHARYKLADVIIAQLGGPKFPIELSTSGGDCLSCGHGEEAVYADKIGSI